MKFFLIVLVILVADNALSKCEFGSDPEIVLHEGADSVRGSKLLLRWNIFSDQIREETTTSTLVSLQGFRDFVKSKIPSVLQKTLLETSIAHGSLNDEDKRNAERTLENEVQLVRPIQCLEALLLDIQISRLNMVENPSEFIAFVLRSSDERRLRVYSYTTNEAGVRGLGLLLDYVERDFKEGWKVALNIHNHNFFFDGTNPLRGTVAPSAADIHFFRSMRDDFGLEEAWITNGFDTIVIPKTEFDGFYPR